MVTHRLHSISVLTRYTSVHLNVVVTGCLFFYRYVSNQLTVICCVFEPNNY